MAQQFPLDIYKYTRQLVKKIDNKWNKMIDKIKRSVDWFTKSNKRGFIPEMDNRTYKKELGIKCFYAFQT